MVVLIRKAKLNELNRVKGITKRAYMYPYDTKDKALSIVKEKLDFTDMVKNKLINVLVAIVNDRIVGAVRYRFSDNKTTHLSRLVVLKRYRNKGIAGKLINQIEIESKKQKMVKIELDFMQEKNLQDFYEKLGYKVIRTIKHGNHHDVFATKNI